MNYEDLRKILVKECWFVSDVENFLSKYEKEIKELSLFESGQIQSIAAVIMESDYMCV